MTNFEKAYSITRKHEGGYSNDPADKGGETYKGIARKAWPNWHDWVLIDKIKQRHSGIMTIEAEANRNTILQKLVVAFFKENFWDYNKLDSLPVKLAEEVFDTSVNMGQKIGPMFLQEALNLCNNNQKAYPNIKVDGLIGPITLQVIPKAIVGRVYKTMNLLQGERYINILRNNESQEKFWGGWLERVIC